MLAQKHVVAGSKRVPIAYPNNLAWECVRCATCCGDTGKRTRHVLILESEAQAIAARTGMCVEEFGYRLKDSEFYTFEIKKNNGKCLFLSGVSCSIYSERPLICRLYPFALRQFESGTFVFQLPEHECRGIGRGKRLTKNYYFSLLQIAVERLTSHCRQRGK